MGCCNKSRRPSRGRIAPVPTSEVRRKSAIGGAGRRGFRGLTVREAASGAVQIARVGAGINVVDRDEATGRLRICADCDRMFEDSAGPVKWWGCHECGCILKFKTMSGTQHCPLGKW